MAAPLPFIRLLLALFAISLVIILIAGLYPKDFRFSERMEHTAKNGLIGSRYTMAATSGLFDETTLTRLNEDGFGIELSLTLPATPPHRLMVLSSISNGDPEAQFLVAQWLHTVIVMTGDDYRNLANTPRLNIDTREFPEAIAGEPVDLELVVSANGTSAFIDGELAASNTDFHPKLPIVASTTDSEEKGSYLTLTNLANRQHGWPGTIRSFLLFEMASGDDIVSYNALKVPIEVTSDLPNAELTPLANYEHSDPEFFSLSLDYFSQGRKSLFDVVLNIAGFVPFGFLFCLLWFQMQQQKRVQRERGIAGILAITLIASFLLSLLLETLQGFIPSRDSTVFDIIFNTAGGLLGAISAGAVLIAVQKRRHDTVS